MKIQKMKKVLLFTVSSLLFACSGSADNETKQRDLEDFFNEEYEEIEENIHVGDNSQVSIDWEGTYKGVLPCADCEGIETTLVIERNGEYELTSNYLTEKSDDTEWIDRGMIKWDETGSNITLISTLDTEKRQFKVGENQLFYLDEEGQVIEGELAEKYILIKH